MLLVVWLFMVLEFCLFMLCCWLFYVRSGMVVGRYVLYRAACVWVVVKPM